MPSRLPTGHSWHAALDTQTCVNHPHRASAGKCLRCRRDFCAECLPEDGELCARCEQEQALAHEIAEQERLTPGNLLRRLTSRRALVTLGMVAVILAAGIVPAALTVREAVEEGIDPELIRRVQVAAYRLCDLGGEGCDLIEKLNGGEASSSSPAPDEVHVLDRVHDGLFAPEVPAWRSADTAFPIVLTFKPRFPNLLDKVVIWNHPDEPAGSYIGRFQVWVSVEDSVEQPEALTMVGEFSVAEPVPVASFRLAESVPARWMQIRILETLGDAGYVSAAEVGMFAPQRVTLIVPSPEASGATVR